MKTYTKARNVHPCKLKRDDLLKLIEIIKDGFPPSERKEDFEISTNLPDISIKANSVEDFLADEDLPHKLNRLSIRIIGWNENREIDKTVYIIFYDNYISLDIDGKDETWVLGKYTQIMSFLNTRKPWFWRFQGQVFSFLTGILPVLSIIGLIYFIRLKEILYSISIGIFLIAWIFAVVYYFKGTFLPYTQIVLVPQRSVFKKENVTIVVAILTLIVSLVGIAINLAK